MAAWTWGKSMRYTQHHQHHGAEGFHQWQGTSWVVWITGLYLHEDKLRIGLYNFSLNTCQCLKKNEKQKQTGRKIS